MSLSRPMYYINDITESQENITVSFVNELDWEKPPQFWRYTSVCVPGPGCEEDDFESGFEGCNCDQGCEEDDFESGFEGCNCDQGCEEDGSCSCIKRFGPSYNRTGQVLNSVIADNMPVIECGPLCACDLHCIHRVVQNGLQVKLQVFKTEHKGFALRTLDYISEHSFVCEYAGEVIGKTEACRRAQAQGVADSNYIYVLREQGYNLVETIVDPTVVGNIGRFINHSCNPNLIPLPVRSGNVIPRICFFAARDIEVGEELTYSYSGSCTLDVSDNSRKVCSCGHVNCKGFLPRDTMLLCI